MEVTLLHWGVLSAVVLGVLVFDFYSHIRHDHFPSLKEAASWSGVYITLALLVGVVLGLVFDWHFASQYFAGWVTEWSLSLDNLFVFVIIIAAFQVPRELQQKVLAIGIAMALVFRLIFILLGAALIESFSWIFYLFGLFLLFTAIQQVREGVTTDDSEEEEYRENAFTRIVRKIVPVTPSFIGHSYFARLDKKLHITPLLLVIIAIGSADVMFAVDSIPAIFGLTQEAFIVFAANAFALLGLRQLYFLHYGLAAILAFIAAKLIIHALATNELPFINGGNPVHGLPEPSIPVSLGFIIVTLSLTAATSLIASRRKAKRAE